jgi:hypothetical protein
VRTEFASAAEEEYRRRHWCNRPPEAGVHFAAFAALGRAWKKGGKEAQVMLEIMLSQEGGRKAAAELFGARSVTSPEGERANRIAPSLVYG